MPVLCTVLAAPEHMRISLLKSVALGATAGAITAPLLTIFLLALLTALTGTDLLALKILAALVWAFVSAFAGIVAGGAAGLVRNLFVSACVGAIVFASVPLAWATLLKLHGEPVAGFVLWGTLFACIVGLTVGFVAGFTALRKAANSRLPLRLYTIFLLVACCAAMMAWLRWIALSSA
jgi:hypothetical protein